MRFLLIAGLAMLVACGDDWPRPLACHNEGDCLPGTVCIADSWAEARPWGRGHCGVWVELR